MRNVHHGCGNAGPPVFRYHFGKCGNDLVSEQVHDSEGEHQQHHRIDQPPYDGTPDLFPGFNQGDGRAQGGLKFSRLLAGRDQHALLRSNPPLDCVGKPLAVVDLVEPAAIRKNKVVVLALHLRATVTHGIDGRPDLHTVLDQLG